jgi:hypothetical protein
LLKGVKFFEGGSGMVGGFIDFAEGLSEVFVFPKVGGLVAIERETCDPVFAPHGGFFGEVGQDKEDPFFVGVERVIVEAKVQCYETRTLL